MQRLRYWADAFHSDGDGHVADFLRDWTVDTQAVLARIAEIAAIG